MRIAPKKAFQPDAIGGEWRRVRSKGRRPEAPLRVRVSEITWDSAGFGAGDRFV